MKNSANKRIILYKELQITHDSPSGAKMLYTCYEAIPNGGFCIISAIPDVQGELQIPPATYIKKPQTLINNLNIEFFPTLIEAINAYQQAQANNAS